MSEIVVFHITGISPVLMNNPASMQGGGDGSLKVKTIPSPEVEAESKVYRLEDGQLYLPSVMFRASIIAQGGGATGRRIGKRSATSVVSGSVYVVEPYCRLFHPKTEEPIRKWIINTTRAVVQKQGVRRSRPEIPEWACLLALEVDTDFITVAHVLELLNISGKIAGIGDFRPNRKGPYGRYKAEIKQ